MQNSDAPKYEVGDIVIFRPRWPNKPAFGIWTSDTELTKHGKAVKISSAWDRADGTRSYSVLFDTKGDGSFYSCGWPAEASEIIGYAEELARN